MNERCIKNCARLEREHVNGRCPTGTLHVVIDAASVERAKRTGHPRLLRSVLEGTAVGSMEGVHIQAFTLRQATVRLAEEAR
jgi:hypothetical protein